VSLPDGAPQYHVYRRAEHGDPGETDQELAAGVEVGGEGSVVLESGGAVARQQPGEPVGLSVNIGVWTTPTSTITKKSIT
jgi:hypothetical protein